MRNEELLKWLNGLDPCICCNLLAKKMILLDELDLLYEAKNYIENIVVHTETLAPEDKKRIKYISILLRELADNDLNKDEMRIKLKGIRDVICRNNL